MSSEIPSILDEILDWLGTLDRPVASLLQDGLDEETISNTIRLQFPRIPEELIELYKWKNGTKLVQEDLLDDLHFFPGFYFCSLEEAMSNYSAFRNDSRWECGWLPIFANGGGDFYAIDMSSAKFHIVGFILGEENQPVEYANLLGFLRAINKCFNVGCYFVSDEGYLEMDDELHFRISAEFNSGLEFYNA